MKEITNYTILITGGAGFIGSNLCEYFLSKGNRVICLDNFATGHRHNLKDCFSSSNFTLFRKIKNNTLAGILVLWVLN